MAEKANSKPGGLLEIWKKTLPYVDAPGVVFWHAWFRGLSFGKGDPSGNQKLGIKMSGEVVHCDVWRTCGRSWEWSLSGLQSQGNTEKPLLWTGLKRVHALAAESFLQADVLFAWCSTVTSFPHMPLGIGHSPTRQMVCGLLPVGGLHYQQNG